jgi:pimeloyl-ACP methyl ester carboxylesterase
MAGDLIEVHGAGGIRLVTDVVRPPGSGALPGFLLVHGLASNARLWDGVVRHLAAAGLASAAIDLRGHGRSGKPDEGYDYDTMCRDLEAAMGAFSAAAEVRTIVAAGQSYGGNLVLELAARHPPALAGAACVDGGVINLGARFASFEEAARVLAPPPIAGTPAAELEARLRATHPDWPEEGIAGTMANFEVRPDETVAPWLTLTHHLAILRAMFDARGNDLYGRIGVPVLLLMAGGDLSSEWAREKAAGVEEAEGALADAEVRWFPGADHDVHAQHPREVAEALVARFTSPP